MSAKASGADTGGASNRQHNQGNQDRKYTVEQKAAVIRVRRCDATAFYDILGLEAVKTSCTDSDIKKAYRKLSLLTHPDKNGHEHADEAFKMVSRAFGVLSDGDKRRQFDRTGSDPDSRFGGRSPPSNPFSAEGGGGGGGGFGGRAQGWEDGGISPEEMFRQFFGGGMGGGFGQFGGGMFDTGPQFVFNMGGGPGIRVHQFGGNRPRRRPAEPGQPQQPQNIGSTLLGLLPLIVLFLIPLLSSLFSGSTPSGPAFSFEERHPYVAHRVSTRHKVDYFTNPADTAGFKPRDFAQMDSRVDRDYVHGLRIGCDNEIEHRQRELDASYGWFTQDMDKAAKARNMKLRSCDRLREMRQLHRQV